MARHDKHEVGKVVVLAGGAGLIWYGWKQGWFGQIGVPAPAADTSASDMPAPLLQAPSAPISLSPGLPLPAPPVYAPPVYAPPAPASSAGTQVLIPAQPLNSPGGQVVGNTGGTVIVADSPVTAADGSQVIPSVLANLNNPATGVEYPTNIVPQSTQPTVVTLPPPLSPPTPPIAISPPPAAPTCPASDPRWPTGNPLYVAAVGGQAETPFANLMDGLVYDFAWLRYAAAGLLNVNMSITPYGFCLIYWRVLNDTNKINSAAAVMAQAMGIGINTTINFFGDPAAGALTMRGALAMRVGSWAASFFSDACLIQAYNQSANVSYPFSS